MGLLARQTINCERIPVGVGRRNGRREGGEGVGWRRARGILPRLFFIRALARAVSRLFLILHRGRECFTLHPRPSRLHSLPLSSSSLLALPALRGFSYESRGIAPRNEFTILIWRATLAIYYLHGVGEKKMGVRCRRRWKEDGVGGIGRRVRAGGPRGRRDNSRGSKIYRIYMRAPR